MRSLVLVDAGHCSSTSQQEQAIWRDCTSRKPPVQGMVLLNMRLLDSELTSWLPLYCFDRMAIVSGA